jgi:putative endonuclease
MQYYVYIMSSRTKVLYIGMTNNLARRVYEHKHKLIRGFSANYNTSQLVYYEFFSDVRQAIGRETSIKGWLRSKKKDLIATMNKEWKDLSNTLDVY